MDEGWDIWLGDIIRCSRKLAPESREILERMAGLLSFGVSTPAVPRADPEPIHSPDAGIGNRPNQTIKNPRSPAPPRPARTSEPKRPAWEIPDQKAAQPEIHDRWLQPLAQSQSAAPTIPWRESGPALEGYSAPAADQALPFLPLIPASKSRAVATSLGSSLADTEELDIGKAVQLLSEGRLLDPIPWMRARTTSLGVQVLMDWDESMHPFRRDQETFVDDLRSHLGSERVQSLLFSGSPLTHIGSGAIWEWGGYIAPPPGTPILVMTDFGLSKKGAVGWDLLRDWKAIEALAARNGSGITALIPHPPAKWPPSLPSGMRKLYWEQRDMSTLLLRKSGGSAEP